MKEPSSHLALVPSLPVRYGSGAAEPSAEQHPLESVLNARLQGRAIEGWPAALARSTPQDRSPFAIRMTMAQVLEVAADADFRAEILEDLAHAHVEGRAQPTSGRVLMGAGDRCVTALREVAADLRRIAGGLVDD